MDRIIYTAAGGAARVLEQQAVISNNLANVNTAGFREQMAIYRSVPVVGAAPSLPTRVSTVTSTPSSHMGQGVMVETGHALDAAITGDGWFSVQTPRSEEHTSELQSLMRISYAVFCLKKKTTLLIQQ